MPSHPLHAPALAWYAVAARDLPWRRPDATPWGVLVSEVMLQQTQVARVEPVWRAWVERWPAPVDLAAEEPAAAVRAWGRLGYPRRALRLHAAAAAIVERHAGAVPSSYEDLLALPGIGGYTAAAVASFAYPTSGRHAVLDTNVRRVHARVIGGAALPPPAQTVAERRRAAELLPDDPVESARWGVAVMELGALVCTARAPRCERCPLAAHCAWRLAGRPAYAGPARPTQRYAGTDRHVRGLLLGVLRVADGAVDAAALAAAWPDAAQRERALDSLVADGLVDPVEEGYELPRRAQPASVPALSSSRRRTRSSASR